MYDPIISKNIRLRRVDLLNLGIGTIIDDFCYISTKIRTGMFVHIAANSVLSGGYKNSIIMEDFSGISACCAIYTGTEMFDRDITTIIPPELLQHRDTFYGDVIFKENSCIGANSVMMPGNIVPEGTVIGANSFVPIGFEFKPWTVYVGNPIREVKPRDRNSIISKTMEIKKNLATMIKN